MQRAAARSATPGLERLAVPAPGRERPVAPVLDPTRLALAVPTKRLAAFRAPNAAGSRPAALRAPGADRARPGPARPPAPPRPPRPGPGPGPAPTRPAPN